MRGVILDQATLSYDGDVSMAPLETALDECAVFPTTSDAQLGTRLANAEVAVINKVRLSAETLAAAPQLKLICLAATGFNNVDIEAARAQGIGVANIRDYCTAAVVQHVFALMLNLNQRLDGYRELLRAGGWRSSPQFTLLDYPFHELASRTLGIVGYGTLGRAVGEAARAFGMRVLVAARPGGGDERPGRVPLETLLAESDVVSLHCPLTPATERLIDAAALARMKRGALLINTARGAVVDETALAEALRAGSIGGAGIDVLSQEPPVDGNPLLAPDIPNLIVTPHIAWASIEARCRAVAEMAENIAAFRRGERRNRVD